MSALPFTSAYTATATSLQLAYDVASLSSNLALARHDETGTYADECRREIAKLRASLAAIEQAVEAMPTLKSEAAA